MTTVFHATLRGEAISYLVEEGQLLEAALGTNPATEEDRERLLGFADGMRFRVEGKKAPYDLRVTKGNARLFIRGIHVTRMSFCHLDGADAVVVVTGEPNYTTSRRLVVLGLSDLRERLADGVPEVQADDLDTCRVIAVTHGLDLENPSLQLVPVSERAELIAFWNVPRSDPPQSVLVPIRLSHVKGQPLYQARPEAGAAAYLERFWLKKLTAAYVDDGLEIVGHGVYRRHNQFVYSMRRLRTDGVAPVIHVLREGTFKEDVFKQIELRNAGALETVLSAPDGRRALITIEDPMRRRHLIEVKPWETRQVLLLKVATVPRLIAAEQVSTTAIIREAPVPKTKEAPLPELVESKPPAVAGPSQISTTSNTPRLVELAPPGLKLSLGTFPVDAAIWPRVYIVGDGEWADLRWWVSQERVQGTTTTYHLHLQCARKISVRIQLDG